MDTERICLLIIDMQYDFLDASSPLLEVDLQSLVMSEEF